MTTQTYPAVEDAHSAQWPIWGTTARVVVTDPSHRDTAREVVEQHLTAVDAAASRFREDSEISRVHLAGGRPQRVSPLLADLVRVALDAARLTHGDVDPTVGAAMSALGYDRDISLLPQPTTRGANTARPRSTTGPSVPVRIRPSPAPAWQRVHVDGSTLTVPSDVVLDLGATAKAYAADLAAADVADTLHTGVLVSLGGDVATAGPVPAEGWPVLVQDRADDLAQTIALPAGAAVATSSTRSRRWVSDGRVLHHVLDPRTGRPAEAVWQCVTVASWRCVHANTLTTAALVRGHRAVAWLRRLGVPARLLTADGEIVATPSWPSRRAR